MKSSEDAPSVCITLVELGFGLSVEVGFSDDVVGRIFELPTVLLFSGKGKAVVGLLSKFVVGGRLSPATGVFNFSIRCSVVILKPVKAVVLSESKGFSDIDLSACA